MKATGKWGTDLGQKFSLATDHGALKDFARVLMNVPRESGIGINVFIVTGRWCEWKINTSLTANRMPHSGKCYIADRKTNRVGHICLPYSNSFYMFFCVLKLWSYWRFIFNIVFLWWDLSAIQLNRTYMPVLVCFIGQLYLICSTTLNWPNFNM